MTEVKKTLWMIEVTEHRLLKVIFDDPVTEAEAQELFIDNDCDIIDEESLGIEFVRNLR